MICKLFLKGKEIPGTHWVIPASLCRKKTINKNSSFFKINQQLIWSHSAVLNQTNHNPHNYQFGTWILLNYVTCSPVSAKLPAVMSPCLLMTASKELCILYNCLFLFFSLPSPSSKSSSTVWKFTGCHSKNLVSKFKLSSQNLLGSNISWELINLLLKVK